MYYFILFDTSLNPVLYQDAPPGSLLASVFLPTRLCLLINSLGEIRIADPKGVPAPVAVLCSSRTAHLSGATFNLDR